MQSSVIPKLETLLAGFGESLGSFQFYIALFAIGISISVAWLMAYLVRARVNQQFELQPQRNIDKEFIVKPLQLLAPLLAIIYLGVLQPIISPYASVPWLNAAMSLMIAYLVSKGILLLLNFRPIGYFIAILIMVVAVLQIAGLLQSITTYLGSIAFELGDFRISILSLIKAIIMLVIVLWVAGFLSRTLESYLRRSSRLNYNVRELMVTFFKVFFYFVAFLIALSYAGVDLTAFAVLGGAIGVGIGLGLQKLAANFISGITLLMERSIQLGDLIEVGQDTGWVRQLNLRYMLVETFDGREIFIPNEEFAASRVTNWTHSNYRARVAIKVGVAYGSDPKQVIGILTACATAHSRCLSEPAPAAFLREFSDSSLNFELTFWIDDIRDGRYGPQSDVMVSILAEFEKAGIDIPFPQRVLHVPQNLKIQTSS